MAFFNSKFAIFCEKLKKTMNWTIIELELLGLQSYKINIVY